MRERSRSLSLVYSGMYTGSMLGLALSPSMIASWGWASVFYVFGLAGLAWYVWWDRQAAAAPQDDPAISEAELRYIARNTAPPRPPLASIPWRLLLSKPATWALIVSHFCHNWGTFILLTWMPTYYNQAGAAARARGWGRAGPGAAAAAQQAAAAPGKGHSRATPAVPSRACPHRHRTPRRRCWAWTSSPRASSRCCPGSPWRWLPTWVAGSPTRSWSAAGR